ncbi:MAG: hypothetical protein IT338_13085 [Thermomicrobiales bacterium]|nr:hypothetical protein [Thermomicrobiales bacterium]
MRSHPCLPSSAPPPFRLAPLLIAVITLLGTAMPAIAWQAAPTPAAPAGFSKAETEHARIYVETGGESDAEGFARSWGILVDDALDQLATFLPPLHDKIEVYVYVSDASYAKAIAGTLRPEPDAVDVLANPGVGDVAVDLPALSRSTPLEAENALRHALAHVAARAASHDRVPPGIDEGLAAYFERPVEARMARHAALVQNARAGGRLLTWTDLNGEIRPDVEPTVFLATTYSMVAFLIDRHGPRALGQFIVSLGNDPDWERALHDAYGQELSELEAEWNENLPVWMTGGWRANLLAAFDLQPARDLLAQGHYATARRELENSLRLFTDLNDDAGIATVQALMQETDIGLQAETSMSQAQAALEQHDYDRAQALIAQARGQYGRLTTTREPRELLETYDALARSGVQAEADLTRARQQSARWVDFPVARAAALSAGTAYAQLGDADGAGRAVALLDEIDGRQRRLVLLCTGLALLCAVWLALWQRARADASLDWQR